MTKVALPQILPKEKTALRNGAVGGVLDYASNTSELIRCAPAGTKVEPFAGRFEEARRIVRIMIREPFTDVFSRAL